MKPFRIIGLAGAAGAGKDTAAERLQARFGFERAAFAHPLKAGLRAMFGWEWAQMDDREWKERVLPDIGKSPRQLMQTLGTEWGRQLVNRDLWLLLAAERIGAAQSCGLPGMVFTDCRFENEATMILSLGGSVLHIARPGTEAVAAHVSEQQLPSTLVTAQIVNDGSIADLCERLAAFVSALPEETNL
jgi:hypothetical protein